MVLLLKFDTIIERPTLGLNGNKKFRVTSSECLRGWKRNVWNLDMNIFLGQD